MTTDLALWATAFAIGAQLQRLPAADRINRALWRAFFLTLSPIVVAFAYTTVDPSRELVGALVLCILSSYAAIAAGTLLGRAVSSEPDEIAAIALCSGFSNTTALGYPISRLLFGVDGLALQAIYAQLCFGVPGVAVSTSVARRYGLAGAARRLSVRGDVLSNPPLLAAAAAVALRLLDVDATDAVTPAAEVAATLIGPWSFLQLGLSMPLHGFSHDGRDAGIVAGILAIRHGLPPAVLLAGGTLLGIQIPAVFFVASAMPVAFHLLTLAAVFDLRAPLVRLAVVASTVPSLAILLGAAALR